MKVVKKIALTIALVSASSAHCQYQLSLGSLLRDMTSVGNAELDTVFKNTQESAEILNQHIQKSKEILRKKLEEKTKELRKKAEEESKRTFERYEKEARILQNQAHKEATTMTRNTIKTLLNVIDDAEKKAQKIKAEKRKKKIEQVLNMLQPTTLGTENKPTPLTKQDTPRWKQLIAHEFASNNKYMQAIIQAGEKPKEAQRFSEIFEKQKTWFNDTLADIKNTSDPRYQQLIVKKKALDTIVTAHKNALSFLHQRTTNMKTTPSKATLNLLTLYEVNYVLQEKSFNGSSKTAKNQLTSQDLEVVTHRVMQKISPHEKLHKYQDTTPTTNMSLMTKEMMHRELDRTLKKQQNIQEKLDKLKKEKLSLEKEIIKKLELTTAEKLDFEVKNKLLTKRINETKKQLLLAEKKIANMNTSFDKTKTRIINDLESTTRKQLEFETIVLDQKNQLKMAGEKASQYKKNLEAAEKSLQKEKHRRKKATNKAMEAQRQANLIHELSEKNIQNYETHFTQKQELLNLKEAFIKEKNELIEERHQWLNQLSDSLKFDIMMTNQEIIENNYRKKLENELRVRIENNR